MRFAYCALFALGSHPLGATHVRVLSHTNALSRTVLPSPWALIPWALAQCAHFALGSQPLGAIARLVLSSAHKLKGKHQNIPIIPPVTGCDERLGLLASRG